MVHASHTSWDFLSPRYDAVIQFKSILLLTMSDGSSHDGVYPSTTSVAGGFEQACDLVLDVGPSEPPHVRSGIEP